MDEEKKKKMKHIDTAILLIVIVGLIAWMALPSIIPEEVEKVIVYPANVQLSDFNDGVVLPITMIGQPITTQSASYVRVTFQLKNTGDEHAMDVLCFIECCDQNGTILFAQLFAFGDLGPDAPGKIPATVSYDVPIVDETLYVIHNIDVRWSPQGTNTYVRLTEV